MMKTVVLCTWSPPILPGMGSCCWGLNALKSEPSFIDYAVASCHERQTINWLDIYITRSVYSSTPFSWPGMVTEWFAKLLKAV